MTQEKTIPGFNYIKPIRRAEVNSRSTIYAEIKEIAKAVENSTIRVEDIGVADMTEKKPNIYDEKPYIPLQAEDFEFFCDFQESTPVQNAAMKKLLSEPGVFD